MKNISVAMALVSAALFSQTTLASDNRLCLTNDTEFVASGYSVQDGIDDPNFDPSIEVQVTYSGKVCTSSQKEVSTLSVPVPNTPIEGDKRTIVQTRGGWGYIPGNSSIPAVDGRLFCFRNAKLVVAMVKMKPNVK
ncbi:hypothetical protein [Shewanella chilikensis]|uniref:hypothetical protein n=1 Tax=Shewanella chilikensis TaxID=558541 RepID=UPI001F39FCFF|nr:hypothetical protein [Shewanella chilikensis]MCE9789854.1 hypothetical protein [Shewanella chilikensis]